MKTTSGSLNIGRLLDRQANLWEIRRRLAQEGGEPARREFAHLKQGPWMTLSKSMGSGWETVAQRVSEHLGWQIFNRELLDTIARQAPARESILSRLDERDVRWLEDTLSRLVTPEAPGQLGFTMEMKRVILALGKQGRTILVGRGANWLLDPEYGLRVRIVAPRDFRMDYIAKRDGITPVEAARLIDKDDAGKTKYIRQIYHHDIDDPIGYDLILNLGSLPPEAAADGLVFALRTKLGAV